MALAARCPHCNALFRVIADQLKLRGGLVRCGECRHVFDAIGSLSYVDARTLPREDAAEAIGGAAHSGPRVAAPTRPAVTTRPATEPITRPRPPAVKPVPDRPRRPAADTELLRDELNVPTLLGAPEAPAPADRAAAAARIEPRLSVQPGPGGYAALLEQQAAEAEQEEEEEPQFEDEESEAPSFLADEEQRRHLRWALAGACVPLALLVIFQIALALRSDVLEGWPRLRPMLARVCTWYGCSVRWPEHAELLTIVGSELAAIPGTDVIELNAAIRSRAGFVMALPALEVTLTDTQNRTIARKVFRPADYLSSSGEPLSRLDEGLSPGSDLSVRLVFEARGLSASGFVLYPFYI